MIIHNLIEIFLYLNLTLIGNRFGNFVIFLMKFCIFTAGDRRKYAIAHSRTWYTTNFIKTRSGLVQNIENVVWLWSLPQFKSLYTEGKYFIKYYWKTMDEWICFIFENNRFDCNKKSVTAQYVSGAISSHPCLTMNMICSLDSYSINLSWEKVCMSVSIIVYYMYLLFIQYLITVSYIGCQGASKPSTPNLNTTT